MNDLVFVLPLYWIVAYAPSTGVQIPTFEALVNIRCYCFFVFGLLLRHIVTASYHTFRTAQLNESARGAQVVNLKRGQIDPIVYTDLVI